MGAGETCALLRNGRRIAAVMRLCSAMVLVALAGCTGGGSHPFAKDVTVETTAASAQDWPRVSVVAYSGMPEGTDEQFLHALAAETLRRQIALVNTAPREGIYALSGSVSADEAKGGVVLSWSWDLEGWTEDRYSEISGREFVKADERAKQAANTGPWQKVPDLMLRRVATHVAENLSSYFAQRGYATQTAGLPPPVETFVRAGPGAEKDINFAMFGPNELQMRYNRGEISLETLMAAGQSPPEDPARTASLGEAPGAGPPRQSPAKPGAQEISAVAVTGVRGAPGDGNGALAAALRTVLQGAGWPVRSAVAANTLVIEGEVGVAPPRDGAQQVALTWTVKSPGGEVLGVIKQANQVPAGSLEKSWGLTADYAAEAAATGIFDLVAKLR